MIIIKTVKLQCCDLLAFPCNINAYSYCGVLEHIFTKKSNIIHLLRVSRNIIIHNIEMYYYNITNSMIKKNKTVDTQRTSLLLLIKEY